MSRIYISSSWKNGTQPVLVQELRKLGHQVYDFRHPNGRNDRNVWEGVTRNKGLQTAYHDGMLVPEDFDKMLVDKKAIERFQEHFRAMNDADTCVLVLPCGRSAHAEAGYMAGAGKRVFIFDTSQYVKPELMYLMFDGYFHAKDDLFQALEEPIPGICRVCGCSMNNPCYHPDHGYCSWVEPSLCSHCATVEQGGFGIKDDFYTVHCVNDISEAFKIQK